MSCPGLTYRSSIEQSGSTGALGSRRLHVMTPGMRGVRVSTANRIVWASPPHLHILQRHAAQGQGRSRVVAADLRISGGSGRGAPVGCPLLSPHTPLSSAAACG